MNIIPGIPPRQPSDNWVGVDIEIYTTKKDKHHLHRPHTGRFASLQICPNDEDVYIITDENDVPEAMDAISDCVWVIQNAKFDILHLRRWTNIPPRKKLWDTMLIERILYNGYYTHFSLAALSRRHLGIVLEKETRDEFQEAEKMTPKMMEYACMDALVVRKIALVQKGIITKAEFNIWSEIDRPALWAFLDFRGFAINVDGWLTLANRNAIAQKLCDARLPFNPRSPKQVGEWFQKNWRKLNSSDEEEMERIINKFPGTEAASVAEMVLKSRMYGKRAGTYGTKFISEFVEYDDGVPVIYTSYDLSRAETSRVASSDPNMANIPARETKAFRRRFISRPGHSLVIADISAQEPCITAVLSKDDTLISIFREKKDVYIELARRVFHEDITKKDPRRAKMKSTFLGLTYGMSKYGLARKENISTDEASQLISSALNIMRGLAAWMDEQRQKTSYVTTLPGRKIHLNYYSSQLERNALNGPVQGTASEMAKKALAWMHTHWNHDRWGPFGLVAYVYDELVADVPDEVAGEVAAFMKRALEEQSTNMVGGIIPFQAEVYIGKNWAEK